MVFKSEKRFYDKSAQKYTLPLWTFDTELHQVTVVNEKTGKVKKYDFYSIYARYHVDYVMKSQPERLEKLVNEGKIYDYLADIEEKTREAIDRQVEKWQQNDRDYKLAVKSGDSLKQARLTNTFEAMARELIFPEMIYV